MNNVREKARGFLCKHEESAEDDINYAAKFSCKLYVARTGRISRYFHALNSSKNNLRHSLMEMLLFAALSRLMKSSSRSCL